MAKGSGIELTPAQAPQVEASKLLPTSPTRTNDKVRLDSVDNGVATSSGIDSDITTARMDNSRKNLSSRPTGQRQDLPDDDNAEGLAGLINVASLSVASGADADMVSKTADGILTRSYKAVAGFWAGKATSANEEEKEQSRLQRTRSSGRPDPYEVPQSPPRNTVEDESRKGPRRKVLKPEQNISRRTARKANTNSEAMQNIVEVRSNEPREQRKRKKTSSLRSSSLESAQEEPTEVGHIRPATKSPDFEKRAPILSAGQMVTPKRLTRSSRTKETELDVNGLLAPDDVQRTVVEESPQLGTASITSPSRVTSATESAGGRGNGTLSHTTSTVEQTNSNPGPGKVNNELQANSSNVDSEEGPEATIEGVSSILLNPSPVKPAQKSSKPLRRPSRGLQNMSSRAGNIPSVENGQGNVGQPTRELERSKSTNGKASNDENNADDESYSPIADARQSARSGQEDLNSDLIPESTLNNLLSIIDKIGRNKKGEKLNHDQNKITDIGRTLTRTGERLRAKYNAINKLKSAEVVDIVSIDVQHQKVVRLLTLLEETASSILSDQLETPAKKDEDGESGSRTEVLEDLYLYGIPAVTKGLCSAARLLQKQSVPATQDLEEFFTILKCLYDLAKTARAQHKSIQPKANKNKSYKMGGPSHQLIPIFRSMYEDVDRELAARKALKNPPRAALDSTNMKRLLDDTVRAEEEEYQRRLEERNRAILISLNARRAELGLVPCSQASAGEKRSSSQQSTASMRDEEDASDHANPEGSVILTGVFGQNNSHPGTTPKEWTKLEMEVLVDGLRRERGPLRYQQLSTRLDRTLDEIFDRAKYLRIQVEYTLKRLQEEHPGKAFPPMKSWIENIGSEGLLPQG